MRYWKRLNPDGVTNTVESYSHHKDIEGATEITEQDFNNYLASLPKREPEPVRDLAAEITAQKAEIDELKARLNRAGVKE